MTRARPSPLLAAAVAAFLAAAGLGCSGAGDEPVPILISVPHAEGSSWTYSVTPPAGPAHTQTVTVLESSPTSYRKRVESEGSGTYEEHDYVIDGASIRRAGYTVRAKGSGSVTTCTYVPADLVVPLAGNVGESHSGESAFTAAGTASAHKDTIASTVTLEGSETVTVPAGTFRANKVTTVTTRTVAGARTTTVTTSWYAPVGRVKAESQPAGDPGSVTRTVLVGYVLK